MIIFDLPSLVNGYRLLLSHREDNHFTYIAELLRRKDLKIRQALEEKQQIIANILNIPYEDFESVVDMAGEPAIGNKEPKELVLAAMFQAKCLQESLNEALNLTEGDIVAARANEGKATGTPLYQAPMTKLMNISTTLSQQLSSLLVSKIFYTNSLSRLISLNTFFFIFLNAVHLVI